MTVTSENIESLLNETSWQLASMTLNGDVLTPTIEESIDFGTFTVGENVEGDCDIHTNFKTLSGSLTAGIGEMGELTNIKFIFGRAQQKCTQLSVLAGVLTIKYSDNHSQDYNQIL
jgi:hypothetical protein